MLPSNKLFADGILSEITNVPQDNASNNLLDGKSSSIISSQ